MTWIKICGLTSFEEAYQAARLGVDALGFNFYRGSRRYISPETVAEFLPQLPKRVLKVGVFVNEIDHEVRRIVDACRLDLIQFHGDEPVSYCKPFSEWFYKAIRVEKEADLFQIKEYLEVQEKRLFLLDSHQEGQYGGTGVAFDWRLALESKPLGELILSGGLHPQNVKKALIKVEPFGVDVASGVEENPRRRPGKKDVDLMRKFVGQVRQFDRKMNAKK